MYHTEHQCFYNTRHKSLKQKPFPMNFLLNFLHSFFTHLLSLKSAHLLPQCWATCILEHWDDFNTQINTGKGETHTSVSRFVTSIVETLVFCVIHSSRWNISSQSAVCKAGLYHLRNVSHIKKYISRHTAEILVYAFTTSRLDFCISLLYELPK